jgi:hypothetical protein
MVRTIILFVNVFMLYSNISTMYNIAEDFSAPANRMFSFSKIAPEAEDSEPIVVVTEA